METDILGHTSTTPIIIAPTGMAKLAHPDGELAIAQAVKNIGIIQCLSIASNTSLEKVASAGATTRFQLYEYKDRNITARLVERVANAGYKSIVVTVDLPVLGVRENLLRYGLQLPNGLSLENFHEFHDTEGAEIIPYSQSQLDSSLTWAP